MGQRACVATVRNRTRPGIVMMQVRNASARPSFQCKECGPSTSYTCALKRGPGSSVAGARCDDYVLVESSGSWPQKYAGPFIIPMHGRKAVSITSSGSVRCSADYLIHLNQTQKGSDAKCLVPLQLNQRKVRCTMSGAT